MVLNIILIVVANSHTTLEPQTKEERIQQMLTKEIDNNNPYDSPKMIMKGQHMYPVLFEPIKHIKLSRSTYKVTSFIDFTPHIRTFDNFEKYLDQVIQDMQNPSKVGMLRYLKVKYSHPAFKDKETWIETFSKTLTEQCDNRSIMLKKCKALRDNYLSECYGDAMLVCNLRRRYNRLLNVTQYIQQDFADVKKRFLQAIDHVREEGNNTTRDKRDTEKENVYHRSIFDKLTEEEEQIIDEILRKIEEYSPEIHANLKRHKRFGLMTWIMGWGVFSNARNIAQIKKNIKTLYQQNILQDKQIHELAHYLNLTATHVQLQDKMIYEINTRLEQINFTMVNLRLKIDIQMHIGGIISDLTTAINRLMIGLVSIRGNVEKIYEYMRVMATHKVHPALIPPPPLRELLVHVKDKMRENPRLELPYDPEKEIWQYYEIMKITPMIVDDLMVILLTIPLTDESLAMNVYKAHNLPAVSPKHGLAARYHLEGEYLAVGKHGLYIAIPNARDIHLCQASHGGLCVMNEALHPVDLVEWCIYALFIQDEKKISKNCVLDFKDRKANLAQSLGGYMWAISSLVGEKIQIRCLTETHVEEIKPPLQVIYVGNGCEGYSPSIMIPARSELTSQYQLIERKTYFLEFNDEYESVYELGPWIYLPLDNIPEEVLNKMVKKLPELPPMTYEHLNERLQAIDEDYPFSVPVPVLFVSQMVGFGLVVLGGIGVSWKLYKMRGDLQNTVKAMVKGELKGKEGQKILTTLMDVYAGVAPPRSIKASTSTAPMITLPPEKLAIQELPQTSIVPKQREGTIKPKDPAAEAEGVQIEEVVMKVLKKGKDVKKLGKYYEKYQEDRQ